MRTKTRFAALFLALSLLVSLTVPALAAETAAVIRLTKTTGTVEISKSSGKAISLLKNMRLYNGYHVETSEESYAWINLDDSKLLKEDAASEVEVRKDGKKLEVQVVSGNVFFDVAEDLGDDESLNIRTSTMVVGIRGTSGWVQISDRLETRVSILEGTVECSVTDPVTGQVKTAEVQGGETATCVVYPQEHQGDKCDILMEKYTVPEIPGFVLTDVVRDIELCDKIKENTGVDILEELAKEAGGDPSGRSPDGKTASPEILGEADRREDEGEADLREKLGELEKEQEKQEHTVSPDKPVLQPAPSTPSNGSSSDNDSGSSSGENSGGGNSGGTTTPDPEPPAPQSKGMKLKDVEIQALLDAESSVSIAPNTDASDTTPKKNVLEVDTGLTVASGKILTFQSGIDMEVYSGKTLQVDGTLTADSLQNDGTVAVTSGDTLRLRGNLTTSGTLSVASTGRVVVDGTFTRSGTLSLASGAAVLAKTFAPGAAPSGWEVSAEADTSGYYTLIPSGTVTPPEPVTYSVTFDANGGKWDVDVGQTVVQTDGTGKIASWPEDPVNSALSPHNSYPFIFNGWYTAALGGNKIEPDHVFAADTQLYARWIINGVDWEYEDSSKTIRIYGTGPTGDYTLSYSSATQEISTAPWASDLGQAETAIIADGITAIGEGAFATAYGDVRPMELKSVVIPNSVASIGKDAFFRCSITNITIPDSVTSIGENAFFGCTGLTSAEIPSSVTSIGIRAFAGCRGLTSFTFPSSLASIGDYAFQNCTGLTSLTLPSSLTSIENGVFDNCYQLVNITIPQGIKSIGEDAFQFCTALTGLIIPSGVTSIGVNAFAYCPNLSSMTIPDSVTSIGDSAFYNCAGLKAITYTGDLAQWQALVSASSGMRLPSGVTVTFADGSTTTT